MPGTHEAGGTALPVAYVMLGTKIVDGAADVLARYVILATDLPYDTANGLHPRHSMYGTEQLYGTTYFRRDVR
eukprot:2034546-Rhodomonas_salina.1